MAMVSNILRGALSGALGGARAAPGLNTGVLDAATGRIVMRGNSHTDDAALELEKTRGQNRENTATARQMLDELARMNRRRS